MYDWLQTKFYGSVTKHGTQETNGGYDAQYVWKERREGSKKLIDFVRKIASITGFENKTIEKRKI
jgi:hypothetical protein